uniref:C2H2-type domain-containing protein n=1 Tax=Ciona savignyi TaxID=51511 RepID=H2YAA0_CIOSA
MEAQTYLDNPSEPQPTETYIAESYPEIQNFSANCQGGAIEKNQNDKTAEIIPENINFNIKKGRPKKKRKREEDDTMIGRAGKDGGDKSVSFACTVCNEVYQGIDKLMQHIEGVHLSLNPHECCICHKRFAQAGNVKRHIRFVHLRERPFECRECNSTFDRLCYLQRHMRTHIDTKANSPVASQLSPCNCPECGKRCLTSHHLRGHLQRKHFAKNKKRSDDMFSKYGHLFSNLEQTEMTLVQPQTMDHDK